MPFKFSIPTPHGDQSIEVEPGASMIFVGANGSGKTRLAVRIEDVLKLNAHRISAHRALSLNPGVAKVSEDAARMALRTGNASKSANVGHRQGNRWLGNPAVSLLNDFDYLVQTLFADQSNIALETLNAVRAGHAVSAELTKFERLKEIWNRLLPRRKLHVTGDNIEALVPKPSPPYPASEMSDGERAIFYLIGQALMAEKNSLLIVDEPELHVHRSIMSKLWDELEAARPDCAFVFITHDLEFAAARVAQKYVIREYDPIPQWTIDPVPEDTGFDEEITTLILGSRKPVLFVEGDKTSLDLAIYRCCFPEWTVIHRGSCENVIHSVVTMRQNQSMTRVTCAGIVDADGHEEEDVNRLETLGIAVLPVSEIENILLLPEVSKAIAETEGYRDAELQNRLDALKAAIFGHVNSNGAIEAAVVRHCRRRIDRLLKKVDLSQSKTVNDLSEEYKLKTGALDIPKIAKVTKERIQSAVNAADLHKLLEVYDDKGLFALAALNLKCNYAKNFESWLTRVLRNKTAPSVLAAIVTVLPVIKAQ